jgi:hypothetical protein
VARAKAYEGTFGPKSVELVVVGQGGAALDYETKLDLENYFNGGDIYRGVLLLNHEVTVTNYIPRKIPLQIEVVARSSVSSVMITQAMSFLMSPTATESDGVSYVWRFGQEVPLSRINSEIFKVSIGNIFKAKINSPTEDIAMNANELPIFEPVGSNVVVVPLSY